MTDPHDSATGDPMIDADASRLLQIANGFLETQAAYHAVRLGIADLVGDGADTADAIAERIDADPDSLGRFLRYLAFLGILDERLEDDTRRYALTSLGEHLRRGSLMADIVEGNGRDAYRLVAELEQVIRTGQPVCDQILGAPFFVHQEQDPTARRIFESVLTAFAHQALGDVLGAYDFSTASKMIDIGGNRGVLTLGILERYPELEATIFDLEAIAEAARQAITEAGKRDRCDFKAGDFFVSVPSGGDLYLLSQVLHDWSDDDCRRILRNIRAAIPDHGRLLIVEQLLPRRVDQRAIAVISDLYMMVSTGGRERSLHQFEQLLESSGFGLERKHLEPGSPRAVLVAEPVTTGE